MIEATSNTHNVCAIDYHNGTLYVKFKSKREYAYSNVSEVEFRQFSTSDDFDNYFAKHIRGRYPYKCVG